MRNAPVLAPKDPRKRAEVLREATLKERKRKGFVPKQQRKELGAGSNQPSSARQSEPPDLEESEPPPEPKDRELRESEN